MRIKLDYDKGALDAALRGVATPMSDAAAKATQKSVEKAYVKGRVNIQTSGLGPRWVKSFNFKFYRNQGLDAAGIVYSPINYGVVFERGAEIKGNPTLWVPLPTTPNKVRGKRLTPKLFSKQVAPLFRVRIHGKDYLAANVPVSKGAIGKVIPRSAAQIKRKPGKRQTMQMVPMFVAASATTIKKRLHIRQIAEREAAKIPQYYADALKVD